MDNTITLRPTEAGIEKVKAKLHKKFLMDNGGDIFDYLGVKVSKARNGTIHLTQPHLIQSILKDLHLSNSKQETGRTLPMLPTKILHPDGNGEPLDC
jgi:hypothetical protein